jgi:hypothetical protein
MNIKIDHSIYIDKNAPSLSDVEIYPEKWPVKIQILPGMARINPKLTNQPRQPSTAAPGHLAYVSRDRRGGAHHHHHLSLPPVRLPPPVASQATLLLCPLYNTPPRYLTRKFPTRAHPSLSLSPFLRRCVRARAVVPGGECNGEPARVGG